MLTHQELNFAHLYAKTLDAEAAALEANYGEGTAGGAKNWLIPGRNGYKPELCDYVNFLLRKQRQRIDLEADKLIQELCAIAFVSFEEVASVEGGTLIVKPFHEVSRNALVAIAEVTQSVTEHGGTLRIKMHDKMAALNMLCRHLGLLKDTVVLDTGGEAMKAIMQAIDGGTRGLPRDDRNPYQPEGLSHDQKPEGSPTA